MPTKSEMIELINTEIEDNERHRESHIHNSSVYKKFNTRIEMLKAIKAIVEQSEGE